MVAKEQHKNIDKGVINKGNQMEIKSKVREGREIAIFL